MIQGQPINWLGLMGVEDKCLVITNHRLSWFDIFPICFVMPRYIQIRQVIVCVSPGRTHLPIMRSLGCIKLRLRCHLAYFSFTWPSEENAGTKQSFRHVINSLQFNVTIFSSEKGTERNIYTDNLLLSSNSWYDMVNILLQAPVRNYSIN